MPRFCHFQFPLGRNAIVWSKKSGDLTIFMQLILNLTSDTKVNNFCHYITWTNLTISEWMTCFRTTLFFLMFWSRTCTSVARKQILLEPYAFSWNQISSWKQLPLWRNMQRSGSTLELGGVHKVMSYILQQRWCRIQGSRRMQTPNLTTWLNANVGQQSIRNVHNNRKVFCEIKNI